MKWIMGILVCLTLLIPNAVEARQFREKWRAGSHIIVENRLGSQWAADIEYQTMAWDAAIPALTFEYRQSKKRVCEYVTGRIIFCEGKSSKYAGQGLTKVDDRGRITSGLIWIVPAADGELWYAGPICHELGHALGLSHNRYHDRSCLGVNGGNVPIFEPGPYDVNSLKIKYRKR